MSASSWEFKSPPRHLKIINSNKRLQAYVIGIALGDGNLTNPNKRAVRLRITCDKKYPLLIKHIVNSIKILLPENKVGIIDRQTAIDISVYSNYWPKLLGWDWQAGPKNKQKVRVPKWIRKNKKFTRECLRGLIQTDGSIYQDRGYLTVNFSNTSKNLADDVIKMIKNLGYQPNLQKFRQHNNKIKYTVRLSKNTKKFITDLDCWKK